LMQRRPTDALTPAVALEVCQREGVKAMLAGSIASVGTTYSLTLTATNCATSEVIATEQATAARTEDVLNALDKMASGMRSKLGESLASIQKYDVPIRASTSNTEALKLLGQGLAIRASGQEREAVPRRGRETGSQLRTGVELSRRAAGGCGRRESSSNAPT